MTTTDATRRGKRTESQVKKSITDWLTLNRIWFCRMNSGMAMVPIGKTGKLMPLRFGLPGMADLVVIRGLMRFPNPTPGPMVYWIECKRPLGPKGGTGGSDQTDDQKSFQREVEGLGCRYVLARDLDDVIAAITPAGARP